MKPTGAARRVTPSIDQVCYLAPIPCFTPATKSDQVVGAKVRIGPVGSLLSRRPTLPPKLSATSTQLPDPLLRALFRQVTRAVLTSSTRAVLS